MAGGPDIDRHCGVDWTEKPDAASATTQEAGTAISSSRSPRLAMCYQSNAQSLKQPFVTSRSNPSTVMLGLRYAFFMLASLLLIDFDVRGHTHRSCFIVAI